MLRFDLRRFCLLWVCVFVAIGSAGAAHVVKKGETLYSIARKNGVSVTQLMNANGIKDVTNLQIGKRLSIPSGSSASKAATAQVKKAASVRVSKTASRSAGSRSKVIIIDPGHGGHDRGASWGGVRESDLNLKTALKLEYYLKKAGYKTVMTRRTDKYVSLSRRAVIANRYKNALFVSVHYNATREKWVRGAETYHSGSRRGRYLASSIQSNLTRLCRVKSRGLRHGRFAVIKNTNCPAVLVECGFLSNATERARCNTRSFQDAAARAMLAGIERYDRVY